MLPCCRKTAKHFEHVWVTWVRIVRSASMKIPRSRTQLTGDTRSEPTANGSEGSWLCRRAEAHHSTSVLDVFSWSRLERIQSATAATQLTGTRTRRPKRYRPAIPKVRYSVSPLCATVLGLGLGLGLVATLTLALWHTVDFRNSGPKSLKHSPVPLQTVV